jgi:hypothetical protein
MVETDDPGTGPPEADAQGLEVPDLPPKVEAATEVEPSAADQVRGGGLPRDKVPYPGGPVPIP